MYDLGQMFTTVTQFSSNWNNRSKCGSRSSNWNDGPLNLNSNNSSQAVSRIRGSRTPRLNICPCWISSKIHYGEGKRLVTVVKNVSPKII